MDAYPQVGRPDALLIKHLLERPAAWNPEQTIIYRDVRELTYREFLGRVHRLVHLLRHLGVRPGDKVGVLDWDSHRYLELFFAVPLTGAVLHTVNVRHSPEQVLHTINHAEDRVLFVHTDFLPMLEHLRPRCATVGTLVLLTDRGERPATGLVFAGDYEDLLSHAPAEPAAFPDLDEHAVATLFYTTGTTGEPKGVFFTHRQLVLHTLSAGLTLAAFPHPVGFRFDDVYMPLTPMFHVHAWGVPYIATLLGLRQVYPGRYEPRMIFQLAQRHGVTLSHCVPTVLQMLLHQPEARDCDLSKWKVILGGAALPTALARAARQRGIQIAQGYGMSETCPIIALSQFKPALLGADEAARNEVIQRTGFPIPLVRVRAIDGEGRPLPPGREGVGELVLQCPWLTTGYYKQEEKSRELWRTGWLHTGDVAFIDTDGFIRITDRLKDVIKVGGEWVSSLELESVFGQHEAVREVAVVGVPDSRWDERPVAEVVLHEPFRGRVTGRDLAAFLHKFVDTGMLPKRAILTRVDVVDAIAKTPLGKIDKRALRDRHRPRGGEGAPTA